MKSGVPPIRRELEDAKRPVAAAASTGQNPKKTVVGNLRYPEIPGFSVRPIALDEAPAWAAYICLAEVKRHTSMTVETVEDVRRDIEKSLANEQSVPSRFVIETLGTRQLVGTGLSYGFGEHGTAEI